MAIQFYNNSDKSTNDWDINDTTVPFIPDTECSEFNPWTDGHVKRVYAASSDDARKHTSGWAMRNTNNHNVNILKKSCLGIFVCNVGCRLSNGDIVKLRPAICDKARRKQQDKVCPNRNCINGRLTIRPCRGHCGYPVTHFWRHNDNVIFFQSKGTHDHARPDSKNGNSDFMKQGKNYRNGIGSVQNEVKSLRSVRLPDIKTPQTNWSDKNQPSPIITNNKLFSTDLSNKTHQEHYKHYFTDEQNLNHIQNQSIEWKSLPQTNLESNYLLDSSVTYESIPSTISYIPQTYEHSTDIFNPDDIFFIDRPIRSNITQRQLDHHFTSEKTILDVESGTINIRNEDQSIAMENSSNPDEVTDHNHYQKFNFNKYEDEFILPDDNRLFPTSTTVNYENCSSNSCISTSYQYFN